MKLTKRMKSSLVQITITNVFLFFVFLGVIFFFAYPRISVIESQKKELVNTYKKLQKIQYSGLSYNNLLTEVSKNGGQNDIYMKSLLQDIDIDFYSDNFINTEKGDYEIFLDDIEKEISEIKNSEDYKAKIEVFNTILPYYSPSVNFDDASLSDIHFINYIEKILYTFNLESQGDIGVGGMEKLGTKTKQSKNLDEGIYKIPLNLKITGRKGDTLDFLHFLENVGNIEIQNDEVRVYEDAFTSKILTGYEDVEGYNIYAHQIVDVESLSLREYPDSSSIKSEKDLVMRIKSEQSREKIQADITLNFYVSGVPEYRIEGFISEFLIRYDELTHKITTDVEKYSVQMYNFSEGKQIQAITSLESLANLMSILSEDIQEIRMKLAQREIEDLYEQVISYDSQLEQIERKYEEQLDLLTQE